jgi:N-acetylmuramoyl-L-alanine amidase
MPDSDRDSPFRKPFGERDDDDRAAPFGSHPPGQRSVPRPPTRRVTPPQELIEVPLVRKSALVDDEAPGEEVLDTYDTFTFDDNLDPPVNDEPERTPAVVRVRDRRGTIPPSESILKTAPQKKEEPAAAASGSRVPVIRFGVLARTLGLIVLSAAIVATLFTWWTPTTFMPTGAVNQLSVALATQSSGVSTTPLPTDAPPPTGEVAPSTLNNIGIVSGHMGIYPETGVDDPGAVCADGLTEAEVNENVATLVVEWLSQHGYTVDLLEEFDPRLQGYGGLAVISIHADSCDYINDAATGFKVASFTESTTPEEDNRLVSCLIDRYADTTGMTFHPSVTYDMTQYHNFREVAPGTPSAIIEVGFMYMDREMLTDHADVAALGIARGLLCYLRDEPIGDEEAVEPTPIP